MIGVLDASTSIELFLNRSQRNKLKLSLFTVTPEGAHPANTLFANNLMVTFGFGKMRAMSNQLSTQNREYQEILRNHLAAARVRNPNYSLRSLAKRMGISPALLSQLMTGTRNLTKDTAKKISTTLAISPTQSARIEGEIARNKPRSDEGLSSAPKLIDDDTFRLIADWYHYAILSLAEVPKNSFSKTWVARRLGITPDEADAALTRLCRLGLITTSGKKPTLGFKRSGPPIETTKDVPSAAIQKHHQQNLEKAQIALYKNTVDERYFGSITAAIDTANLPELKKLLRSFRSSFRKKVATSKKTQVYQFCIQLFPIDYPDSGSGKGSFH